MVGTLNTVLITGTYYLLPHSRAGSVTVENHTIWVNRWVTASIVCNFTVSALIKKGQWSGFITKIIFLSKISFYLFLMEETQSKLVESLNYRLLKNEVGYSVLKWKEHRTNPSPWFWFYTAVWLWVNWYFWDLVSLCVIWEGWISLQCFSQKLHLWLYYFSVLVSIYSTSV